MLCLDDYEQIPYYHHLGLQFLLNLDLQFELYCLTLNLHHEFFIVHDICLLGNRFAIYDCVLEKIA